MAARWADGPPPPVRRAGWCVATGHSADAVTGTRTRTYDNGRPVTEMQVDVDPDFPDRRITWSYDGSGRVLRHTETNLPDSIVWDRTYHYDGAGRLIDMTLISPGDIENRYVIEISGDRVRALRELEGGNPTQLYEALEWDEAEDRCSPRTPPSPRTTGSASSTATTTRRATRGRAKSSASFRTATYSHRGDLLFVTDVGSGCVTTWEGEHVEVQRVGGIYLSQAPDLGPGMSGARAYYEIQGTRLSRVCGDVTEYEAEYDAAGNLLRETYGPGNSTDYSYDCWR